MINVVMHHTYLQWGRRRVVCKNQCRRALDDRVCFPLTSALVAFLLTQRLRRTEDEAAPMESV